MLTIGRRQNHRIKTVVRDQVQGIAVAGFDAVAIGCDSQRGPVGIGQSSQNHPRQMGQHVGVQLTETTESGETDPQWPG